MPRQSPIRDRLADLGGVLEPFGEGGPDLCQALAPIELEYGAIRTKCAIFDEPHRTYIEIRGGDRLDFLNRMLTQELKGIEQGQIRNSFWLNRKGRIDADLRVIELGDSTLLEVDTHAVARTIESLNEYVFAEDVVFENAGDRLFKLGFHGPMAADVLANALSMPVQDLHSLGHDRCDKSSFENTPVLLLGGQLTGESEVACVAPPETILALFDVLTSTDPSDSPARPVGWQALNIARIEAGQPQYLLDFGPGSLPAETGLLEQRVSFTKGCYLGQEIVARMQSLGHPKQTLIALRWQSPDSPAEIPETGASVRVGEKEIGAITSATLSPMLGREPVAFAMVRWGHHEPETELEVNVADAWACAKVQSSLTLWKP